MQRHSFPSRRHRCRSLPLSLLLSLPFPPPLPTTTSCASLPVTVVRVSLARAEQRKPEFIAKAPMGKLPVLEDSASFGSGPGSFLPESGAILRHLCRTFLAPRSGPSYHLYPHADPAAAALVDAAVDWHFSSLRPGCSGVVWALVLAGTVPRGGAASRAAAQSPAAAQVALASLELALDALEGQGGGGVVGGGGSGSGGLSSWWLLSPDGGFLAGRHRVSIADLLVATELDQLRLLEAVEGGSEEERGSRLSVSLEGLLAPRPRVRSYLSRVREAVGSGDWDEVSSVLGRVVSNLKGGGGGGSGERRARL